MAQGPGSDGSDRVLRQVIFYVYLRQPPARLCWRSSAPPQRRAASNWRNASLNAALRTPARMQKPAKPTRAATDQRNGQRASARPAVRARRAVQGHPVRVASLLPRCRSETAARPSVRGHTARPALYPVQHLPTFWVIHGQDRRPKKFRLWQADGLGVLAQSRNVPFVQF